MVQRADARFFCEYLKGYCNPSIITEGLHLSIQNTVLDESTEWMVSPMKQLIALILALLLLFPAAVFAEEKVSFSDPVFELKFRQQIGRPEGDIFADDCENVTELHLNNVVFPEEDRVAVKDEDKVHSLADVDKFPNVVFIEYANNAVSDLAPLAQLSKLVMIEGPANYVSDIGPIANLTSLYHVVFWENRISNIEALQNLHNLQVLSLFNNQVTDISVLSDKTNLTILELNGNPIKDFSPVDPILGQLEYKDFNIEQNSNENTVNTQDGNENAEMLQESQNDAISTQENPEIDASAIPDTPLVFDDPMFERALRDAMGIYDRPITQKDAYVVRDIEICNDKTEGSRFSDISPLQYFVNLQRLIFNSNLISDLSPLASLDKLQILYIAYNQISDITPLANLTSLIDLSLQYNRISDISALSNLTGLRRLNLEENPLESIMPLEILTQLESVNVWLVRMDTEGVASLMQLPNLHEAIIHMEEN